MALVLGSWNQAPLARNASIHESASCLGSPSVSNCRTTAIRLQKSVTYGHQFGRFSRAAGEYGAGRGGRPLRGGDELNSKRIELAERGHKLTQAAKRHWEWTAKHPPPHPHEHMFDEILQRTARLGLRRCPVGPICLAASIDQQLDDR